MSEITDFLNEYVGDNDFLLDLAEKVETGRLLTKRQTIAIRERSHEFADWLEERSEQLQHARDVLTAGEQLREMRKDRKRTAHRWSRLSKDRRAKIVEMHRGQQPVHVPGVGSLRVAADGTVTPR